LDSCRTACLRVTLSLIGVASFCESFVCTAEAPSQVNTFTSPSLVQASSSAMNSCTSCPAHTACPPLAVCGTFEPSAHADGPLRTHASPCLQLNMATATTAASTSTASSTQLMAERIMGAQATGSIHHNLAPEILHGIAVEHDKCTTSSTGALIAFSGASGALKPKNLSGACSACFNVVFGTT
jgi:hypothetical protein